MILRDLVQRHLVTPILDHPCRAMILEAIFSRSRFERRFRDIHILPQQTQPRDAHYETVGQVLFGNLPEVFL